MTFIVSVCTKIYFEIFILSFFNAPISASVFINSGI